jgi:hypothetical protein
MLRHLWPGAKPAVVVTSTKSHAGKETIVDFAAGGTPKESITYDSTDWAFKRTFHAALESSPAPGVVNVENARLDARAPSIASGFLEGFLTTAEPFLFCPGMRGGRRRRNDLVVAITTNEGRVSEDLMNRSLPVHLAPVGDVASRRPAIGNPRLEYLPANRARIEAELRGMIERWKSEGRPREERVSHPFGDWARAVGGILAVNGFTGFLDNYHLRKTADDPVRKALALLGAERPGEWLRPGEWARLAVNLGLVERLVPAGERAAERGRERKVGEALKAHDRETFEVATEDAAYRLQLEHARRRFEPGQEARTRYRFLVLDRTPAAPAPASDGLGGAPPCPSPPDGPSRPGC